MAGNEDSSPVVVCDAGPLIHLDELASVDLLSDFSKVIVPTSVWAEVERYRPNLFAHSSVDFLKAAPQESGAPDLVTISRLFTLHRGELEALKIASDHPGCIMLTDDSAARLAAQSLSLAVHGTIGILIRAIRRKQRSKEEILAILRLLKEISTLHIRSSLLNEIIEQVEET
jgi:predicted nucleic acid-binding protein